MKKRRYPPGERKDRIAKLLEYVASNPGCRRLDIQAHMNFIFKSTLRRQTVSEYLRDCTVSGLFDEKDGQFFITKLGEAFLTKRKREMQKK
jgi:predicted transcriptional regulator